MIHLSLYSTLGCHLCEEAEAVIAPLLADRPLVVEVIDIADSDELMARYGIRIPVVKRTDTGEELGWPFDKQAFLAFLL